MAFFWACFVYSIEMKQLGKERFKPFPCFLQKSYGSADGKISWNRQATIIRVNPQTVPTGRGETVWIKSGLYLAHGFIDKSVSYDLRLRISGKLQVYCIVKGNWAAMRVNCFFKLWENSIRIVSSMAMWSEYVPSNVLYSRAENILVLWNIAYWISVKPYFSTIIARSFACSSLYTTRASRFSVMEFVVLFVIDR